MIRAEAILAVTVAGVVATVEVVATKLHTQRAKESFARFFYGYCCIRSFGFTNVYSWSRI